MIRLYVINKDMRDDIEGAMYRVEVEIRTKRRETDERYVRSTAWLFVTKEVWDVLKPGSEYPLSLDTNEIVPPPPEEPVEEPSSEGSQGSAAEETPKEEPPIETLN